MIEIYGVGAVPSQDATVETLRALERAETVFTDLVGEEAEWLKRMLGKDLRAGSADEVLREGKKSRVGLVVWGHARYTSRLARDVGAAARRAGVACRFHISNSPLSRALAKTATFLGLEGHQGVCAYELEQALARPRALRTRLPVVVYAREGGRWGELAAALSPLYPRGHWAEVLLGDGSGPWPMSVQDAGVLPAGAILVIPPVAQPLWRKSSGRTRPAQGRGLTP